MVIRRTFDAPRDLVWRALTDPEMRAQWWGPRRYTTNVRELDVRVGGKWRIDHVGEDGQDLRVLGRIHGGARAAAAGEHLPLRGLPAGDRDDHAVRESSGRTTLTNVTAVDTIEHRKGWVETGMESGARESMERLADLLSRMKLGQRANDAHQAFAANQKGPAMERKVTHATFKIERTFDCAAEGRVPRLRRPEGQGPMVRRTAGLDSRREVDGLPGRRPRGGRRRPEGRADVEVRLSTYYDIVPNERIVYAYEMYLDDNRISVSVATIEFKAVPGGTRLVLTEQGAFLDGFDNPALREEGTRALMDQLAASLKRSAAA